MFPKQSIFSFRSVAGLFPLFREKSWRAFSQFSVCSSVGRSQSKPTSLSCGFWPCFAGVWIPEAGLWWLRHQCHSCLAAGLKERNHHTNECLGHWLTLWECPYSTQWQDSPNLWASSLSVCRGLLKWHLFLLLPLNMSSDRSGSLRTFWSFEGWRSRLFTTSLLWFCYPGAKAFGMMRGDKKTSLPGAPLVL